MMKYKTIKKLSEESGLSETTIRLMLKNDTLNPYYIQDINRIFVNIEEFELLFQKKNSNLESIDFDRFKV